MCMLILAVDENNYICIMIPNNLFKKRWDLFPLDPTIYRHGVGLQHKIYFSSGYEFHFHLAYIVILVMLVDFHHKLIDMQFNKVAHHSL